MRLLVAGGAGFFGGYVVAALEAAGHEAIAYDIAPPRAEMLHAAPVLASRTRLGAIGDFDRLVEVCRVERIEGVVHAAGLVGFENSLANPRAFYETNIMGFVNVCEASRALGLRKIVLISSNSVYHRAKGEALAETDLPFSTSRATPAGHYGASKMACEAIGLNYVEFHDLDILALRVTAIYGFGMRSPLYIKPMVENAVRGEKTSFATGGPMKRDYTHVLDCASAVVRAVDLPRLTLGEERVFNIALGRATTAAELAEIVRSRVPGADIEIGDGLTPREAENLKMRAPLDVGLAKRILGWAPQWGIEDGVGEYVERFRDYVKTQKK
jgi:nucleoside-diphosphate-sugar epimerase